MYIDSDITQNTINSMSSSKVLFNKTMALYKSVGLFIEVLETDENNVVTKVKIKQKHLYNGYILNQKQLVERAKFLYSNAGLPKVKVIPVVYSFDVSVVSLEWLKNKMDEFGIKRSDLLKQLSIDKSSLSLLLSGKRKMNKLVKAAFYYYFLTYELNRDFRE